MSINKVLVHTQYEENYGFHEGNFHWKKKGGHTFSIEMDADILMYSNPAEVFGKMLESHNSDLERFTYLEHEVQWQTPTVLGTQEDYIREYGKCGKDKPYFYSNMGEINILEKSSKS